MPLPDPRMRILASDDFDRADGTLGANWTTRTGAEDPQIVSSKLRAKTVDFTACSGYTGITWPNNQWSQGILDTVGGATYTEHGLILRYQVANALRYRCYITGPAGAAKDAEIRDTAGAVIATRSDVITSAGDLMTFDVVGTRFRLWQNSTLLLTANDSVQLSGSPGVNLYISPGGSLSDMIMDDWIGGDFAPLSSAQAQRNRRSAGRYR